MNTATGRCQDAKEDRVTPVSIKEEPLSCPGSPESCPMSPDSSDYYVQRVGFQILPPQPTTPPPRAFPPVNRNPKSLFNCIFEQGQTKLNDIWKVPRYVIDIPRAMVNFKLISLPTPN